MDIAAQQAHERIAVKSEYFVDVHVWPGPNDFDPKAWLSNFPEDEAPLAALMLDGFMYISRRMCDAMLYSAVQAISSKKIAASFGDTEAAWQAFLDSALFCMVTGEEPNPSDSGHLFLRKVRQVLEVEEERLFTPHDCLRALLRDGPRPVIFVDDFLGSGNQFVTQWYRQYPVNSASVAFADIEALIGPFSAYYAPALATRVGADNLLAQCPEVELSPAHLLDEEASLLHPECPFFPSHLRAAAQTLLKDKSLAIGIDPAEWRGYRSLGLAIAFEHGVPDATLPIFYHERSGWKPLLRRR